MNWTEIDIDKYCIEYEKVLQRMRLLQKKKEKWGLADNEKIEINKLVLNCMQYKYQIIDITFCLYIEPILYDEKIIDIKMKLKKLLQWDGELLFFEVDLNRVMDKVNENNYNKILILLKSMRDLEIEQFNNLDQVDKMNEIFGEVCDIGENCVEKYIKSRYNVLENLIRGEINEKITD